MRAMRQGGDAGVTQIAQITVVKAHDGDILGNPDIRIVKLLDEPIGDLVVVADDGGAPGKTVLDKVCQKAGVLPGLQGVQISGGKPADMRVHQQKPFVPQAGGYTVIPLRSLHIIELKQPGDIFVPEGAKMLRQKLAAVVVVILDTDGIVQGFITIMKEKQESSPLL